MSVIVAAPPRTILVNHTFALRFFKNVQDAIGNRTNNDTCVATIIGVVGDVHQYSLMKPPSPARCLASRKFRVSSPVSVVPRLVRDRLVQRHST
jgi:hypothetical protein